MELERIKNFPVSFFAVTMGLTGGLIVSQKMEDILGIPSVLSLAMMIVSFFAFCLITIMYFIKVVLFRDVVRKELVHPVKMHFFPTFSVSLLLLSVATLDIQPVFSEILWFTGAGTHIAFTFYTLSTWIQHTHFEPHHVNPSWFIPILGNLVVPVAGVVYAPSIVNWFFFSAGILFWILLFGVIFNRLIFHNPLPQKLMPTLFILIAPPAVAFIAYVKITGSMGNFGMFLYSLSIFMFLLVCAQWRLMFRIRFYLSWWAYSFPLAALDLASVLFLHKTGQSIAMILSVSFFFILTLVLLLLSVLTLRNIAAGNICIDE